MLKDDHDHALNWVWLSAMRQIGLSELRRGGIGLAKLQGYYPSIILTLTIGHPCCSNRQKLHTAPLVHLWR